MHAATALPDAFAPWRGLDPATAVQRLLDATARLTPTLHRAVFARLLSSAELLAAFTATRLTSDPGPLHGVPFVIKDLFPLAGETLTAGSTFLASTRPPAPADGRLVSALRAAGAVPVGRTQLHEFAYGITGENPHHGHVPHPRDPARTSGGSSSGSAYAVAAGLVPLAFGTDTAGSIRVPAAFCGLHGVRLAPHHPWLDDSFPLAPSFDTPGWFTADAASLAASLTTLTEANFTHAHSDPRSGAWLALPGVDPDLASAQAAAAQALQLVPLSPELAHPLLAAFAEAPAAFNALRAPEAFAIHEPFLAHHREAYDPTVLARIEAGQAIPLTDREAARHVRLRLLAAFDAIWSRHPFLALPATPCPPFLQTACNQAARDRLFALTTPASLAGLPTLSLPVPLPSGLSTGLQVLAPSLSPFLRLLDPATGSTT